MKMQKPSRELIATAKAVVMAKAVVETLEPRIKAIQAELLDVLDIHCDPADKGKRSYVEGVLTPANMYCMSDADAALYYGELDKEYRKAGFNEIQPGQCPLLLAKDLLRKAERLFMETSIEITAVAGITPDMLENIITCAYPNGLKRREEYLDINLRYVVPFIPQGATI